ncbi:MULTISPECIES: Dabb family protein [unclassified Pseudomonas]|uniref:Dabb family protein n=1 Tax=unclassified Pseudomonas TaxID=196821 RepID=UPI0021C591FF|nr:MULTISPECIES: Dabb family protein [unclassified Pseudomonas]MCU1730747.1 Dabb family protein [Pseudomonas sp. 20P_3.2_Bac4]MCU1742885.1 Dabb family protein [Pseudomonas sp. 20P_3.2_Bac5]
MMRHVVLFRRLAGVEPQPELETRLVERMRTLEGEIDFIRDWKVAANELERPICWDYILDAGFDDAAAVERYLPHPAHQALVADLKQYFEWVAVDYSV